MEKYLFLELTDALEVEPLLRTFLKKPRKLSIKGRSSDSPSRAEAQSCAGIFFYFFDGLITLNFSSLNSTGYFNHKKSEIEQIYLFKSRITHFYAMKSRKTHIFIEIFNHKWKLLVWVATERKTFFGIWDQGFS